MAGNDLHAHFLNNSGRKLHKWLHYFDIYESHFARFRNRRPKILEIGVSGGGSLEMWRDYFGEGATILGLDVEPACKAHEALGATIYIGSQDDPVLLQQVVDENGPLDIVIDDGSHRMDHMAATLSFLYRHVQPNGCYLVEDMHTCYWADYGGGLKRQGSFMEVCKDLVDELNAQHTRGEVTVTDFTRSTASITFYDSVCVFEKRPQGRRLDVVTAGMSDADREPRVRRRDRVKPEASGAVAGSDATDAQRLELRARRRARAAAKAAVAADSGRGAAGDAGTSNTGTRTAPAAADATDDA